MINPAVSAAAAPVFEPTWTPIEIFTGEQRVGCEIRITGRLRARLADNEPVLRVRNVTTIDASPAMPRLSAVTEGLVWRSRVVAFSVASELPDPDAPALVGRPILFEGNRWVISAQAMFPAGAERERHLDQLMQAHFWPVDAVRFTAEWGSAPVSWSAPHAYVNVEQALSLYLG